MWHFVTLKSKMKKSFLIHNHKQKYSLFPFESKNDVVFVLLDNVRHCRVQQLKKEEEKVIFFC